MARFSLDGSGRLKLNRESAAATYDSVVRVYNEDVNVCDKGLRVVIDETKKTMKLSRDVPYSEVADLSIFRDTQRELAARIGIAELTLAVTITVRRN